MPALVFTVYGESQPKGSMKSFVHIGRDGQPYSRVTHGNEKTRAWELVVAKAASAELARSPDVRQWHDLPIRISVAFHLRRPQKYMKRRLPVAHQTAPDLDKLCRLVCDALTSVVWHDDSQVVELFAIKRYAEVGVPSHVVIRVEPTAGVYEVTNVPPAPLGLFDEGDWTRSDT